MLSLLVSGRFSTSPGGLSPKKGLLGIPTNSYEFLCITKDSHDLPRNYQGLLRNSKELPLLRINRNYLSPYFTVRVQVARSLSLTHRLVASQSSGLLLGAVVATLAPSAPSQGDVSASRRSYAVSPDGGRWSLQVLPDNSY